MHRISNLSKNIFRKLVIPESCHLHLRSWNAAMSSCRVNTEEYQYLPKSMIPTMYFQASLPRLPIPQLEKTCQRYLAVQKVLSTDTQYKETEKIVKKFQEAEGKKLHEELLAHDERMKHSSYVADMWYDAYVSSRDPLPLNYNPVVGIPDVPDQEYSDQLIRATNFLISSLRFMKSLRSNRLESLIRFSNPTQVDRDLFYNILRHVPDSMSMDVASIFKAIPLDMNQFERLFNTTRIPQIDRDEITTQPDAKHMLILYHGHIYVFDVLDSNGLIKDPAYLQACLANILSDQRPPAEFPVSALTTLERNSWARLRQRLSELGNEENLKLVDSAFYAIGFDDISTSASDTLLKATLCGNGSNLWFDKSMQIMISKNGKAFLNLEHSSIDGMTCVKFVKDVIKDSIMKPEVHPSSPINSVDESSVRRLEFILDNDLKHEIKTAFKNFKRVAEDLHMKSITIDGIGKNLIKTNGLNSDAMFQLSLQIAHLKYKGKFVAIYESCSTAKFRRGRTEAIRPTTLAAKQCAEAFLKSNFISNSYLKEMMSTCSKEHKQLVIDASAGQGFDRHLFALRVLSERAKLTTPAIFQDPAYEQINYFTLSTSTLNTDDFSGCFGPVVPDGFGMAYQVMPEAIVMHVSNFISQSDGANFHQCFEETWEQLNKILKH